MSCDLELAGILAKMGMPGAFHNADFSGIDGTRELFISEVVHKTVLSIDEDGAEGAASTAAIMKKGLPVFLANHPFVFFVKERRTGTVLFIGRVTNPSM